MKTMSGSLVGFTLAIVFLMISLPSTFGQITIIEKENETAREFAGSGGKYTFKADADTVDILGKYTTLLNYGRFNTVNVREGSSNVSPSGYIGYDGSSVGTLNLDGGRVEGKGHIDTVNIGFGTESACFVNSLTGTVGTVNINDAGGRVDVYNSAFVDTLNMNREGLVFNDKGGHINTANINGRNFRNYSTIDTMNVGEKGIETYNWGSGSIDRLNMDGGYVYNYGYINTADVTGDGWLSAREGSTTGTVNVSDNGRLSNRGALIKTVDINGGTVESVGRIDDLIYTKGTYKTSIQYSSGTASIGTLTAAGTLQATNTWGLVENLQFDKSGSGQVSITSYVSKGDIGFTGVKADNVNFAYGNIWLDLARAITFDSDWILSFVDMNLKDDISFATLFNAEDVTNAWDLNSFYVSWSADTSFGILADGKFADGWGFNSDYTWFVYGVSTGTEVPSSTPEPATLAMFGLGLAGLPLFRRLRKK